MRAVPGPRTGWRRIVAAHPRLAVSAGVAAVLLLLIVVANLTPADGEPFPPGCPGVADPSIYATAEPRVIHRADPNRDNSPAKPIFSAREADIFRQVAFSGFETGTGLGISLRWERKVVTYILGEPTYVELAVDALETVADLASLDVEVTSNPDKADLTICVGMSGLEHRENARRWEFGDSLLVSRSPGLGGIQSNDSGEITAAVVSTSATFQNGEFVSTELKKAAITEEITQAFGPVNDFSLVDFRDVGGADTSLFVDEPFNDTLNELDRRIVSTLYGDIPTGSSWDEARDHIRIFE